MSDYSKLDDERLLTLMKEGNESAFTEIYNRYWEDLYRFAYHLVKDRDSSMDVLQDVFIWIWNHRLEIDVTSLKSYLYSAVKYKIANYIRDGKTRINLHNRLTDHAASPSFVDSSMELAELKAVIEQFTDRLPGRCKELFTLSRSFYLNNKEVVVELNIFEISVENQLTIAFSRLRLKLGIDYCFSLKDPIRP